MYKHSLLEQVKKIATDASFEILKHYKGAHLKIETKDDNSPLTKADLAAHKLICAELKTLTPEIPIISEESSIKEQVSSKTDAFWLVDPLDGTKEFISQNGEFTVNIALIEKGLPTLGVVALPDKNILYTGLITKEKKEAFKQSFNESTTAPISTKATTPSEGLTVVGSRSHQNNEALDQLLTDVKVHQYLPFGSSLKFCQVAEGNAHLYPRLGRTMEWDTAAGHAVLRAAGGEVFCLNDSILKYGKKNLENPHFIAKAF